MSAVKHMHGKLAPYRTLFDEAELPQDTPAQTDQWTYAPPETDYAPFTLGQHNRKLGPARVIRNGMPVFKPYKYRGNGTDTDPETARWGHTRQLETAQTCPECNHGINTNSHYNRCLNLGMSGVGGPEKGQITTRGKVNS